MSGVRQTPRPEHVELVVQHPRVLALHIDPERLQEVVEFAERASMEAAALIDRELLEAIYVMLRCRR